MALEKYTDLYDFAPVGYFSLDESGVITGGEPDGRRFARRGTVPAHQPALAAVFVPGEPAGLSAFPERVFTGAEEAGLRGATSEGGRRHFLGRLSRAVRSLSQGRGNGAGWRFETSPPSSRRRRRNAASEALADRNLELDREITRRQAVENVPQESEQTPTPVAGAVAARMQEQLRTSVPPGSAGAGRRTQTHQPRAA